MSELFGTLATEMAQSGPVWALLVVFIMGAVYFGKITYDAFDASRQEHAQQISMMFERVDTLQKEVREDANKREEAYRVERDMLMQQLQDFNKALTNLSSGFASLSSVYSELREDVREMRYKRGD